MSITPCRSPWGGTLSPRERFTRQMHWQPIDRSFNMEFGYWQENYDEWDLFTQNGIKNESQANEFFGFDQISTIGTNTWLNPGFPPEIVAETDTSKTIRNSDGLLAEMPKDGHSTIPHYSKPSVVTPDDWKRAKEAYMQLDDPVRIPDIAALKARHPAERDYPLGISTGSMIGKIRDMLTFEGVIYATFDYPDMVEDMVETCCQLVEQSLDRLLPHVDFDYAAGWEDICFKNGPIITMDLFEQVVMPRYKRIGKKLKAAGIDLWYTDCDGDVRPLIPGFLDAGINCLFPFEVNCCTHAGELLDQYDGQLRIMGGVNKLEMIKGKAAIKAYLESLAPYVERGGYIPFCDHRCPPDVTPENYLYYLDLKRQMFGTTS